MLFRALFVNKNMSQTSFYLNKEFRALYLLLTRFLTFRFSLGIRTH